MIHDKTQNRMRNIFVIFSIIQLILLDKLPIKRYAYVLDEQKSGIFAVDLDCCLSI